MRQRGETTGPGDAPASGSVDAAQDDRPMMRRTNSIQSLHQVFTRLSAVRPPTVNISVASDGSVVGTIGGSGGAGVASAGASVDSETSISPMLHHHQQQQPLTGVTPTFGVRAVQAATNAFSPLSGSESSWPVVDVQGSSSPSRNGNAAAATSGDVAAASSYSSASASAVPTSLAQQTHNPTAALPPGAQPAATPPPPVAIAANAADGDEVQGAAGEGDGASGAANTPLLAPAAPGAVAADSSSELHAMGKFFERSLPFLLLLLAQFLYAHAIGLIVWLVAYNSFVALSETLKQEIAKRDKRNVRVVASIAALSWMPVFVIHLVFSGEKLWLPLVLRTHSQAPSLWQACWIVLINDVCVKLGVLVVKAVLVLFVGSRPPFKRHGQLYGVVEAIGAAYRTIIPIPVWFTYFVGGVGGKHIISFVVSAILTGLYLCFKALHFVQVFHHMLVMLRSYSLGQAMYGVYASRDEVVELADGCSICQDMFVTPIKLPCGHIFCEDCIGEWFDRERTCPLCRQEVQAAGIMSHTDGSSSLIPVLF